MNNTLLTLELHASGICKPAIPRYFTPGNPRAGRSLRSMIGCAGCRAEACRLLGSLLRLIEPRRLRVIVNALLIFGAAIPGRAQNPAESIRRAYDEEFRGQFHYTAQKGFISDPNGLVFYKGEYHLFHQYNPFDVKSGVPQHWGHAISTDLVHWTPQPIAVYPHAGGNIWSGSAVVDWKNSSGLQTGAEPPLVAFYTWQKDFTQRLIYSNDRGRTWREYDRNPVLPNIAGKNRDPKVFWHEPSRQWIMVLYVQDFDILSSTNLLDWKPCSTMPKPAGECPDMFELPVDGNSNRRKWVVVGADGRYNIGSFDGKTFTKESGAGKNCYGQEGLFYATQTWSDVSGDDGRRIQIACLRDDHMREKRLFPDLSFNNQMTFPCALSLRNTTQGIRLFRWPVKEIESIYDQSRQWHNTVLEPDKPPFEAARGDLFDISTEIKLETARKLILSIRGTRMVYDCQSKMLTLGETKVPLAPASENTMRLRILVDRGSLEVFTNEGEATISKLIRPSKDDLSVTFSTEGGTATLAALKAHSLKSIWRP